MLGMTNMVPSPARSGCQARSRTGSVGGKSFLKRRGIDLSRAEHPAPVGPGHHAHGAAGCRDGDPAARPPSPAPRSRVESAFRWLGFGFRIGANSARSGRPETGRFWACRYNSW
jgi:hypothetical protein